MKSIGTTECAAQVGVASRVEAWIEMRPALHVAGSGIVASRVEAWIEIEAKFGRQRVAGGRLPRGGVD